VSGRRGVREAGGRPRTTGTCHPEAAPAADGICSPVRVASLRAGENPGSALRARPGTWRERLLVADRLGGALRAQPRTGR
jgi:hypothetical protein